MKKIVLSLLAAIAFAVTLATPVYAAGGGASPTYAYGSHVNGYLSANHLYDNGGNLLQNVFVFDGTYTYFARNDGTPMTNYLTYHPDGVHIIYFDEYGHELFDRFQYCAAVGYTCYFDSQGYLYKDQLTFRNDGNVNSPVYLNENGKLEDSGWFAFYESGQYAGNYGYAYSDGVLADHGFDYIEGVGYVYFHWNGMVARGLITDGRFYYSMSEQNGAYQGKFAGPDYSTVYYDADGYSGVNVETGYYTIYDYDGYGTGYWMQDVHSGTVYKAGIMQDGVSDYHSPITVYVPEGYYIVFWGQGVKQ